MINVKNKDNSILYDVIEHPHRLGFLINKNDLTELHSHWIKFIWYPTEYFKENGNWKKTVKFFNDMGETFEIIENGKIKRVKLTKQIFFNLIENKWRGLQGHRGSFKSTALVIIGSIVKMIFEPDARIGIVRKDFTKASKFLKNISNVMKTQFIKELFKIAHGIYPKAIKDRDNILSFNFKQSITPEGNINAYGIHATITGDHLDFILLDDFVTLDDKVSRAEREKTKIRIEEIVTNVLDPGKQCGFVGTPWHKDDAWSIPVCPSILKFDIYITGLLSKAQIELKRKTMTNITFAANCELRHALSEDTMFKNPSFGRWEFQYRKGIGHLDKKYWGIDTNALTFCEKKKNGRYQVIGWVFNEHIKDKIEFIKEKWEKYYIGTIHTEDNDDKGTISDIMRGEGILMDTYHESMNKHVKIQTHILENGFWDLIDFDPDTDPEYLNQILDYIERSEPDDAPDSLASMGRILISSSSSVHTDRWSNV
jgi:hypothetical protein